MSVSRPSWVHPSKQSNAKGTSPVTPSGVVAGFKQATQPPVDTTNRDKLEKGLQTAIDRIAIDPRLSEEDKLKEIRIALNIADGGDREIGGGGIGIWNKYIKKPLATSFSQFMKGYNKVMTPWQNLVASAYNEVSNIGVQAALKTGVYKGVAETFVDDPVFKAVGFKMPDVRPEDIDDYKIREIIQSKESLRPSFDRFLKNQGRKDMYLPFYEEEKFAAMPEWMKAGSTIGMQVAADPLTYTGVGAAASIGRAQRVALSIRMVEKYGDAVNANKIIRYGVAAIPKNIRQAEGLEYGLRFAGKVLPRTEKVQDLYTLTLGKIRPALGDVVYSPKAGLVADVATALTPKSAKGLVQAGAGRTKDLTNAELLPELFKYTGMKYAKGAASTALHGWQKELVNIGETRRDMMRPNFGTTANPLYDPEAVNMYRYIEMSDSELALQPISDGLKDLVRRSKKWFDDIRTQTNGEFARLGEDFNLNVSEIGYVDDFFHHRMTQQAKEWVASDKGQQAIARGLWRPDDITLKDLTDPSGPFMYRRLKGGSTIDPKTGEEVFETFFGVPVRDGTVDEINKIFGDYLESQKLPRMNWFETDAIAAMDSYAYSMSRAVGRTAFIRRAFDFGEDVVRPLIKKVVPDAEIAEALTRVHDKLIRQQNFLRTRIATNTLRASDYARQGLDYATRFLKGEMRKRTGLTKEITRLSSELDRLVGELADAAKRAGTKEATARGEFDAINRGLLEQIGVLKKALEDPERYAATVELRRIYATMYPNHNPETLVGKSAEWIAEKISNGKGVPAARELRKIRKSMADMRDILDSFPDDAAYTEIRRELEDVLAQRGAVEQGYTNIANVRAKADYSDGLLYGYTRDLGPWPEQEGAKILRTKPMDEFFDSSPEAIAIKAIDADSLTDLRDPDVFEFFWREYEQYPEALADAMRFYGLDEVAEVFEQQFKLVLDEGTFDPLAVQMYPEVTSMIEEIMQLSKADPDFYVGEEQIYEIFTTVRDRLMRTLDLDDPEGLDELVANIFERSYHEYTLDFKNGFPKKNINTVNGTESAGLLLPQSFVDDMELDELAGQWATILPHQTAFPRKPSTSPLGEVLSVADNEFVQTIRQGLFEPASLEATTGRVAAENALMDAQLGQIARGEAQKQLKELAARKGGLTRSVNATRKKIDEAKAVLARTNSVEIEVNGVKQTVTRQQAQEQLVRLEGDLSKKLDRLTRQIDAIYADEGIPRVGSKGSGVINKVNSYKERLPMLLNQAKVLKRWSNDTGITLARDIQDLRTLVTARPPKGAAAGESAAWVRKVDRTLDTIGQIADPAVQRGYERVTSLLHADEAQLSLLESVTIPKIENQLDLMRKGLVGNMVETTLDGWESIAGLGVQMPEELLSMWKPNIEKILSRAGRNKFLKAYDYTVRFFKTYATSTVGFLTRNGLSATIMNWVADVSGENMVDGFKAAMAIGKGPEAWAKFLDDLPEVERALFQSAWEATEATGRGQSDELAALVVRGGNGERILNNAYTRAFRKKNEFVERAVRFPMALDSLRRGQSFDQAVARIARYHFDYSDLSSLDEAARQMIPFWIWTSRNVPLQIVEQMVHPRAYAIYERVKNSSPVDDDIMMPKWIADWNPIAIGGVNSEGGQWVATPDLPFVRMEQQIEQITDPKKLLGQLAPIVRVPMELAFGKQIGIDAGPFRDTPQPVNGFDKAVLVPIARVLAGDAWIGVDPETGEVLLDERFPYVSTNALPLLGQLYRTTGGAFGGRSSRSYQERQLSNIFNWFGIPVRYVGPDQQESEAIDRVIDIGEWMKQMVKKGKFTEKDLLPELP